ncbi:NADPH:quinone reductase-like Zn-dependent oxidoreductase [Micromonospora pisi]|uniref:NADPH:quinone reductase-like Zn-dependent oxidoreductase n=1 Tax=Micromonospora pisi TaxID=589240 RepID=A0A495JLH4_9ACTN|nr:NADPH:quinone reductase [Micromonospora pisi]RKR89827.1 NADPH:quinone reductase-like Zn-dependent oxidoreductase [Micromonospora pisi]
MKAAVYTRTGEPGVLELVDQPVPEPDSGEVLVRMALSGVNPTDVQFRAGKAGPPPYGWQIPGQDGAGVIEATGQGVDSTLVGERVWVWEAASGRPWGTAAEYTLVPSRQIVLLGSVPFEMGAALGIPFLTAHRCLTVGELMPRHLDLGSLADRVVLVQGGAGAVGNAAIQLARWADATVIATVSTSEKAQLAAAAGASHVINYRQQDVVAEVKKIAPHGVDTIVEVSGDQNAAVDAQVIGHAGVVSVYSFRGEELTLPVMRLMPPNARWQFVTVYQVPAAAKAQAVQDVATAAAQGGIRVGADAGLPLHYYPLAEAADAHTAVEHSAVGKVLISTSQEQPA